jgi:hypothetical protein
MGWTRNSNRRANEHIYTFGGYIFGNGYSKVGKLYVRIILMFNFKPLRVHIIHCHE